MSLRQRALGFILTVLAMAPAAAQELDTIPILETSLVRVALLSRAGDEVGGVTLDAVPVVGARAPDGSIWVGCSVPPSLFRVSPTGAITAEHDLPTAPGGVAVDAVGRVWVSSSSEALVRLHDSNGDLITTYPVGTNPRGVAINGAGNCWVANFGSTTLSRISPFGLVFNFPVGTAPLGIATHPSGGACFTDPVGNTVQFVSVAGAVTNVVPVGQTPEGVAVDGLGRTWVTTFGDALLWQVDGNDATAFAVGNGPRGVSIDGRGAVWVSCAEANEVFRVEPKDGSVTQFLGFSAPSSVGDLTGFSLAHVVNPAGDMDGDGVANGIEIEHGCNPFDPALPEIGRVTPHEVSVEGGATLEIEGCGFGALVTPGLEIGGVPATAVTIIGDSFLTATVPAVPTPGLASVTIVDGNGEVASAETPLGILRNPGQVWIARLADGALLRRPVRGSTSGGFETVATGLAPRGLAVDSLGGIWVTDGVGGTVRRFTADGVPTDVWILPSAGLAGITVGPDGSDAWVAAVGAAGNAESSVFRLPRDAPFEGPFGVGLGPEAVAVTPNGEVWVACPLDGSVHILDPLGTPVDVLTIGAAPSALAATRDEAVWLTTRDDGFLRRLRLGIGVELEVPVGALPTALAVGREGKVWVALAGDDEVVRVSESGEIEGSTAVSDAPSALAVDGTGSVWVTHALSGVILRLEETGEVLETIVEGTGHLASGDFAGTVPLDVFEPFQDQDADGFCNDAELFHDSDPFRPESQPVIPFSFSSLDPPDGLQTGGEILTIRGCGYESAPDLGVLLGVQALGNLTVVDDSTITGVVPAASFPGPVAVVINSSVGTVLVSDAFRYRVAPVETLTCEQSGVPVTLAWSEPQVYDTVAVFRNETLLAQLPGGQEGFLDASPVLGASSYAVLGTRDAEAGPETTCAINVALVPPTNFECEQSGGMVVLTWDLGDVYDEIEIRRDGALVAVVQGATSQWEDPLPPLGSHDYSLRARRDGVDSADTGCFVVFEILAVQALSCVPNFGLTQLSWSNPFPYDAIRIRRDEQLLAEIDGASTEFVDDEVDEGFHTYSVAGVRKATEGPDSSCEVVVPVLAVTDLSCVPFVFDVTLNWTPGIPDYDSVTLLRDGTEIAVLPGDTQSYFDESLPLGVYLYAVIGAKNDTSAAPVECEAEVIGPIFVRGDVNGSGAVGIEDAIFVLGYITGSGTVPPCLDAADSNDSGLVDIADPVHSLNFLFANGPAPPAPYPAAGPDPTPDPLGCATSLGPR